MAAAEGDGGKCQNRREHLRQHSRRHPNSFGRPALAAALPFHLLEFTVISAQGLYPASRSRMRTYASVCIDPENPLSTKVDRSGHTNPTWNDKFVFRVDEEFLRSETSAIDVRLYAARGFAGLLPDRVIGEVRVVISTLHLQAGHRRFVALMVRRPSTLQPHGILNLGVSLLDPYIGSMPLYYDLGASSSSLAYKDHVGSRTQRETSMPKIREEPVPEGLHHGGGDKERVCLELNESGEFRKSLGERERKELLSKIEMWKAEISPDDMAGNLRKSKKKSWFSRCFCGGSVLE